MTRNHCGSFSLHPPWSRSSGVSWLCRVVFLYEGRPETFLEKMSYQLVERMVMHPRNLLSQGAFWEAMFRSMSADGVKVSYMVPVNAIFRELRSRYFPGSGPESNKSLISQNLDYRRAWEIVDSLGHSEIIERFRRGTWE